MQIGALILYSAFVGALTGAFAAGFVFLLRLIERYLLGETLGYLPPGLPGEGGLTQVFRGPSPAWLALLLPLVFAASSYLGSGRGLGWLLAAYRSSQPVRAMEYLRGILGALVQLGAGSPMGREGPMAALGLWVGSALGRRIPLGESSRFLPFAGMAAGFASAFHAPMAGALLASEIVYRGLALEVGALAPALIGALSGFTLYGLFHGYSPLLELTPGPFTWPQLLFGLITGLVCAGVGTLWLESERLLQRLLRRLSFGMRHALFGAMLALALLLLPEALGNGLPWVQLGTSPILTLPFLGALLLVQLALLILAGGVRAYGGQLTPALALGGLSGLVLAELLGQAAPSIVPSSPTAALVGITALLAGLARAPFAAVVLAGEIGGYGLLPLSLTAAFAAYTFTSPKGSLELEGANPDRNGAAEPLPESARQTLQKPPPPTSSGSP
ncbi:H(+)/Cl(-) exchange transporter ClcA [Meiothermus luteus]|uniref:H(+)/Cl(-) exchange transporter ClcA n=1 Tax=Meiothermus luteus TaxID=2026184 RepID=A0A399EZA7_9DEIN|nr:chloride channel protein [Meiothermus luteus]RIH89358.1 H(+)/Cl(-) exchange transporter ClcA [Meiothermus luteus]RMH53932.1 MAG: chloride channel protein [Deinococcota bacterium]